MALMLDTLERPNQVTRSNQIGWAGEPSPELLQQLAVALPDLLVDRIHQENEEAQKDERDGCGRDQQLEG